MTEPISKKSGTEFRRARAHKKEVLKTILDKTKKIDSFFVSTTLSSQDNQLCQPCIENNVSNNEDLDSNANLYIDANEPSQNEHVDVNNHNGSEFDPNYNSEAKSGREIVGNLFDLINDDPSKWCVEDPTYVDQFLRNKLEQDVKILDFSQSKRCVNGTNRMCNLSLFYKRKVNGEVHQRTWIFYSQSLGKIFCIFCIFFAAKVCGRGTFVYSGFDDWKHSNRVGEHETSKDHCEAAYIFMKRSIEINRIETALAKQLIVDQNYWREILKRIFSVIRFLASRGLPFREYDTVLKAHIEKYANKGKGNVSYMSSTIADEFIQLLALEVRNIIIKLIRRSKYFSIIVDSTPDVSHIDQLTIIIRYIDENGVVKERFLAFLENVGHKGQDMVEAVVDLLEKSGLMILDCRGQSYDNAKNMSGKYKGLKTRILAMNPFAVYIPCGGHSLNLVVEHAAGGTSEAVRFFMFIQNIYVFFAGSTKRWGVLLEHLNKDLVKRKEKDPKARLLVPKRLSETRWSARDDASRALKSGYSVFVSALNNISNNQDEKKIVQVEAKSLRDEFFKLETAILLELWSDLLHKVNTTSKSLQNISTDVHTSILLYKSLSTYVKKMRCETSFKNIEENAKLLIQSCSEWEKKYEELTYNCYNKRTRKRNTKYDYGNSAETIFEDSDYFRINIFYATLDSIASELDSTIEIYETVFKPFSFMFKLESLSDSDIRKGADNLRNIYVSDIDTDFAEECIHFKFFMNDINSEMEKDDEHFTADLDLDDDEIEYETEKSKNGKSKKLMSKSARMLQYIRKHKIQITFPNNEVALRIFECIAVSNCSGERSFNALKRVKNYLRSTVQAQKLNDVSVLYIESDILNELNSDLIIDKFVEMKARKRFI